MSLQYYHIIHLIAVMALFAGTGAALAAADHGATRKFGAILRGVALLLLLVTGFGLLAKMGIMASMPLWVWLKLAIWMIAALLPVFVKRKLLPGTAAALIALALGGVAAWLGYMKPF
jgi:uncharacterized membrane protein SirB2